MMKVRLPVIAFSVCILAGVLCLIPAGAAFGAEIRINASERLREASPGVFGNSVILGGDTMGFNEWVSNQREYEEAERTWNSYLSLPE